MKIQEIVKAFQDIVDGDDARDIHYNTGLPPERCSEIYEIFQRSYTEEIVNDN